MRRFSADEIRAVGLEAARVLAATGEPADFAVYASKGVWELPPHLKLLNDALVRAARGETKKLLVMMPPRHGKSMMVSQYFPVWYLGQNPGKRVILASYEHDFAATWGAKARNLMDEWGPQLWGVEVDKQRKAADDWALRGRDGGMVCAGVGSAITGRGGNILIADDLVKDAESANSETQREKAWDWWRSTFYTRLEPGGAMVFITTRWHLDDPAGRLLAQEPDEWEVISLTALAGEGDALGRAAGEALWPERYDEEALAGIRESIGPYWFEALFQQRPTTPAGTMFHREWWRYYEKLPVALNEQVLSVDCSFKDTKASSYVVIQCWGNVGRDFYLCDQIRQRMGFTETVEAIRGMAKQWPDARFKLIEDKANGPAVISALDQEMSGIVPVNPLGGKVSRAQAASKLVSGGKVYLPQPKAASWVMAFLDEAANFPVGRTDDQVDAMTQALSWMSPTARDEKQVEKPRYRRLERHVIEAIESMDAPGRREKPWVRPTTATVH